LAPYLGRYMIDWPLAFTTATNAIKLAHELRNIDKQLGEADLKLKIADLTTALADLKITLTEARAEVADKEEHIRKLEQINKTMTVDTVVLNGKRYRAKDGKPVGHMFCPVCSAKEGILIEVFPSNFAGRPDQCPSCKMLFHNAPSFAE
jgi:rubrerythrin